MKDPTSLDAWRDTARDLCARGVRPCDIFWTLDDTAANLFDSPSASAPSSSDATRPVKASKQFLDLAEKVLCHRDDRRFDHLYRVLMKMQDKPRILENPADEDVHWCRQTEKSIRRDIHKTHAFVRFRKVSETDGKEQFAAWFEPTHLTLRLSAPFFQRRFPNMDWVIVTPDESAIWKDGTLTFGPGASRSEVPDSDVYEDSWRTYFGAIFNPARLKINAMTSEMPRKYWKNLPEASLIPQLIQSAAARESDMIAAAPTKPSLLSTKLKARVPIAVTEKDSDVGLAALNREIAACTSCPLHCHATQSVCGEGPESADLMIVGEQPGDIEDLAGTPFIGPAGQLLDHALDEAQLSRPDAYVTNAVKHFKFKPRGKRRIHQSPSAREIDHCQWWLRKEIALVKPKLIVTLGAAAARSVLNHRGSLSSIRGHLLSVDRHKVLPTIHPSYLLRVDQRHRAEETARFIDDLAMARRYLSHCHNDAA